MRKRQALKIMRRCRIMQQNFRPSPYKRSTVDRASGLYWKSISASLLIVSDRRLSREAAWVKSTGAVTLRISSESPNLSNTGKP